MTTTYVNDIDDELAELNAAFDATDEATDAATFKLLSKRCCDIRRAIPKANPTLKLVVDDKDRFAAVRAA